jgi:hypothetical protein
MNGHGDLIEGLSRKLFALDTRTRDEKREWERYEAADDSVGRSL